MAPSVRIQGLRELQRSLNKINKEVAGEVRDELTKAVEPIRGDAEHRAFAAIRNIGAVWSRMRTGVTTSTVYIAPATRRGRGSPRPNLGTLLMDRAMWPALEDKQDAILDDVEEAFDRLVLRSGFH